MIVVTGGAGFIGSALIWKLNQLGYTDIVSVDRLGLGNKWQNLAKRSVLFNLSVADFPSWFKKHRKKVEVVFHLGACSSTTERDADFLMTNNVHYSRRIWKIATEANIPLLYASSAATYGAKDCDFIDSHDSVGSLLPINKYGWSKQVFDRWALSQESRPEHWFGFKFFNVYGPQEYHKGAQASVVYHAYPQIKAKGQLKLFQSHKAGVEHGQQIRDFVYIKDVVAVMVHFWQNLQHAKPGIYNLGTGQGRSFAELGKAVFEALGMTPDFQWIPMPESIRDQYQYFTEADLNKLRDEGGYTESFTSLEAGIGDYVTNYLDTNDRYL